MKWLLIIFTLFSSVYAATQTSVFTDPRDNQQYKTIVINNKKWFRENLRFQTSKSFCPNFNKDSSDCRQGNYYSNSELNTICPPGWHVATIPEWESFLSRFLQNNNINNGVIKYDTSKFVKNHFSIRIQEPGLLADTLLYLVPTGWVEGIKLKKNSGFSIWATDTETHDEKYHLHLGNEGFIKHTHEHHIIDKPAKIRKFPVRCVCEVKAE